MREAGKNERAKESYFVLAPLNTDSTPLPYDLLWFRLKTLRDLYSYTRDGVLKVKDIH